MCCLVTASKPVNNTRSIATQLLGKQVSMAMDTHAMVKVLLTIKMETVFSMWFVPKCYKQGQSEFWS
jgi:hypothetical protein